MTPRRSRSPTILAAFAITPFVLFAHALDSRAAGGPWSPTPLPVFNAKVTALAVAPTEPSRLYLGALENGIYRTDDRGDSWVHLSSGLPAEWSPEEIAISPLDADHVLAGGVSAVHRTTNGGATWEKSTFDFDGGVVAALAIADGPAGTVFAGVRGGAAPGIVRSTDGGLSWAPVAEDLGAPHVDDLAVNVAAPTVILAATSSGVARSTDSGDTWAYTSTTPMTILSWSTAPARVYGITAGSEVSQSLDAGETFDLVGVQPPCGDEVLGASLLTEMELVSAGTGYCAGPPPPVSPSYTRVMRSVNGGASWSQSYRSQTPNVGGSPLALVRDPSTDARIYLGERGDHGAGLLRTSNGGSAWSVAVSGIRNYSIAAVRGDASGTSYALWEGAAGGLVRFEGAGENAENSPSLFAGSWSFDRVFHASEGVTGLLFQAGTYFSGDLGYEFFHRSTNGGATWEWLDESRASLSHREIATSHGTGQFVYLRGAGQFARSEDKGETFDAAGSLPGGDPLSPPGREPVSPHWTVVDPEDPSRLFSIDRWTVYESTDGAQSWEPRDAGLPPNAAGLSPFALFMRPTNPEFLHVVYSDGRIFRSTDGGSAWSPWKALVLRGAPLVDVTWDPATGHLFAATGGSGVVSTLVMVSTLVSEGSGLPDASPTGVHFSPASGILFVGTSNAGLVHRRVSFPRSRIAPDQDEGDVSIAPATALVVSPNPMVDAAEIRFAVPRSEAPEEVRIDVFDTRGRRVRVLRSVGANEPEGRIVWDGHDDRGDRVAAGIYFVRFETGRSSRVEKVVVLR